MGYSVEYGETARKQLRELDRPVAKRVIDYLDEVGTLDDARARGKGLVGARAGVWRYRVGDYRVLCEIRDAELVVLALDVGHRSTV